MAELQPLAFLSRTGCVRWSPRKTSRSTITGAASSSSTGQSSRARRRQGAGRVRGGAGRRAAGAGRRSLPRPRAQPGGQFPRPHQGRHYTPSKVRRRLPSYLRRPRPRAGPALWGRAPLPPSDRQASPRRPAHPLGPQRQGRDRGRAIRRGGGFCEPGACPLVGIGSPFSLKGWARPLPSQQRAGRPHPQCHRQRAQDRLCSPRPELAGGRRGRCRRQPWRGGARRAAAGPGGGRTPALAAWKTPATSGRSAAGDRRGQADTGSEPL